MTYVTLQISKEFFISVSDKLRAASRDGKPAVFGSDGVLSLDRAPCALVEYAEAAATQHGKLEAG